jgi:hypothetical protein
VPGRHAAGGWAARGVRRVQRPWAERRVDGDSARPYTTCGMPPPASRPLEAQRSRKRGSAAPTLSADMKTRTLRSPSHDGPANATVTASTDDSPFGRSSAFMRAEEQVGQPVRALRFCKIVPVRFVKRISRVTDSPRGTRITSPCSEPHSERPSLRRVTCQQFVVEEPQPVATAHNAETRRLRAQR